MSNYRDFQKWKLKQLKQLQIDFLLLLKEIEGNSFQNRYTSTEMNPTKLLSQNFLDFKSFQSN